MIVQSTKTHPRPLARINTTTGNNPTSTIANAGTAAFAHMDSDVN